MGYFKALVIISLLHVICSGHNLRQGLRGQGGQNQPSSGGQGGTGSKPSRRTPSPGGQGDSTNPTQQPSGDLVEFYKLLIQAAIKKAKRTVNGYFQARHNVSANDESDKKLSIVHGKRRVRGNQRGDLEYIETNALILEQASIELEQEIGIKMSDLAESTHFQTAFTQAADNMCRTKNNKDCKLDDEFRSANGVCNNIKNRDWGSALTSQERYLSPAYDDGIRSPRSASINNGMLPSPRQISNNIMKNTQRSVFDRRYTIMHMAWGQFIDHDMVLTPISEGSDGSSIVDCCTTADATRIECYPISIPDDDGHFTTTCMNFVRSTAGYPLEGCNPGKRQQINALTSFLDGSQVYGSSKDDMDELRMGIGGLMNVSLGDLPPPDTNDVCVLDNSGEFCLKAGDVRVNVVPHLQALHTLFLREHNRIATKLSELNTKWGDGKIFDHARKIVGALLQHITYNEYLPILLGEDGMDKYQLNSLDEDSYDEDVNPNIKNAFAAAAFRFGHSQVSKHQIYLLSDYTTQEEFATEDTFLNPHMVVQQNGQRVPDLSRWMCTAPSYEVDRIFERSIRDFLFDDGAGHSFDLASLNIQRGRDHGLPSYNKWREFCGLQKANNFTTTTGGLIDHTEENAQLLSNTYSHVDDIDLYVGALTEKHTGGGIVGPTFACIIGKQFSDLKKGDRFWYERPNVKSGFTADQLAEIKKVKLSKVLCNNFGMGEIQLDVFGARSQTNRLMSCSSYEDMDLLKWQKN